MSDETHRNANTQMLSKQTSLLSIHLPDYLIAFEQTTRSKFYFLLHAIIIHIFMTVRYYFQDNILCYKFVQNETQLQLDTLAF